MQRDAGFSGKLQPRPLQASVSGMECARVYGVVAVQILSYVMNVLARSTEGKLAKSGKGFLGAEMFVLVWRLKFAVINGFL